MNRSFTVAVLGSTGYVGLELVKILSNHPNVKIVFLGCENLKNKNINFINKEINKNLPLLELNNSFDPSTADFVFLALPHGISNLFVKKFYKKVRIIDLSADFRLDSSDIYSLNYNKNHSCPELLNKFIYGLSEINKKKIINSSNISIPGCYPTSILTPIIPLLQNNLIMSDNIIIDSKSGYSGAGKKFDLENININSSLNFYNYNTNDHRHICEIKQELNKNSKNEVQFSFNPHILPIYRGMMSTIYCDLNQGININNIQEILLSFYKNSKFIKILNTNENADFFKIKNTNNCLIKVYKSYNESKIIIVSLIDNLLKGAAGQAIQCFNISLGFDEAFGLNL